MESLTPYVNPEDKENIAVLNRKAKRLGEIGNKLIIKNDEDFEIAQSWLVGAKRLLDEMETRRKKITKPINDGLKEVNDMFRGMTEVVDKAYSFVNDAIVEYRTVLKRRAEEEKVKRALAAKKFEEDQKKELEKKAKELEKQGLDYAAENIRNAAGSIVAPIASAPKFENTQEAGDGSVGGRKNIEIDILNFKDFVNFCVSEEENGRAAYHLISMNLSDVKKYAKANKKTGKDIPGLLIREKESLIVRTK